MDLLGGEVRSAVKGQQILALEKDERFQSLAALELAKDAGEGGPKFLGVDLIVDGTQLSVARDLIEPENPFEVELIVSPLVLERQQRRCLEREQGKSGHERASTNEIAGWRRSSGTRPNSERRIR